MFFPGYRHFRPSRFIGQKFNDVHILSGKIIEFVVNDLNHDSSVRFAYAAYKLIERNWKRYPILSKLGQSYHIKKSIDDYFRERLKKYLR